MVIIAHETDKSTGWDALLRDRLAIGPAPTHINNASATNARWKEGNATTILFAACSLEHQPKHDIRLSHHILEHCAVRGSMASMVERAGVGLLPDRCVQS